MGKQPKREKQIDYSMVPPDADDFVIQKKEDSVKKEVLQAEEEFIQKTRLITEQKERVKKVESRKEEKKDYKKMAEELVDKIRSHENDGLPKQYMDQINQIKITLVKIKKSEDIKDQEKFYNELDNLNKEIEAYLKNKAEVESRENQNREKENEISKKINNAEKLSKKVEEWNNKYKISDQDPNLAKIISEINTLLGYIRKSNKVDKKNILNGQLIKFQEKYSIIENFVDKKTKNVRALFEKLLLDPKYKEYKDDKDDKDNNDNTKEFHYSNLDVDKGKNSDEVVNNFIRKLMFDFVVHGVVKNDSEIYKFSDLDGKSALEILKLSGFDISQTEFVRPGESIDGNVNLDTGGYSGVVKKSKAGNKEFDVGEMPINEKNLEEAIHTLYIDHHGKELSNISATKIVYELLVEAGLLEKQDHLDDYVEFVNKVDNADWGISKKEYFDADKFSKTLLGLKNYFTQDISKGKKEEDHMDKIIEHFKNRKGEGKSMREIITEELDEKTLEDLGFDQKIEQDGKEIALTEAVKNRIKKSESALNMLNKLGFIFDTKEYGRVVININKFVANGNDAALPYKCKTIVSPGFISSNKKDLSDLHEKLGGILIRGCMLKLTEGKTLKDILQNMLGNEKGYNKLVEDVCEKSDKYLASELEKKFEAEIGKLKMINPERLNEMIIKWKTSIADWPQNSNKAVYGDGIFNSFLLQIGDQKRFNDHKAKIEEIIKKHINELENAKNKNNIDLNSETKKESPGQELHGSEKFKKVLDHINKKMIEINSSLKKMNSDLDTCLKKATKEGSIIFKRINELLSQGQIEIAIDNQRYIAEISENGNYEIKLFGDIKINGNIFDKKTEDPDMLKKILEDEIMTTIAIKQNENSIREIVIEDYLKQFNLEYELVKQVGINLGSHHNDENIENKLWFLSHNQEKYNVDFFKRLFLLADSRKISLLKCAELLDVVKSYKEIEEIFDLAKLSGRSIDDKNFLEIYNCMPEGIKYDKSAILQRVGYIMLFYGNIEEGIKNLLNLENIPVIIKKSDKYFNVINPFGNGLNIYIDLKENKISVDKTDKSIFSKSKKVQELSLDNILSIRQTNNL